ncbi:MAG: hypothetical protein J6B86_05180 [Clostridia bacterium]|nr:hypothetical protein [Clostridia bacterium]
MNLLPILSLFALCNIPWLLWFIYKKLLRKNKKLTLIIVSSVVLISLITTGIVNANILSERETFSSKSEMLKFLNGKWVSDNQEEVLIIDDEEFSLYSYVFHSQGTSEIKHEIKEIKYYPKRGCFIVSTKYRDIKFTINSKNQITGGNNSTPYKRK